MAGRKLFDETALRVRRFYGGNFTICDKCFALLWFEEGGDTLHVCYQLQRGVWKRPIDVMACIDEWNRLSLILRAAISEDDPDRIRRFRRDNLCRHYDRIVGDCARLYVRFLRQRAHFPIEVQETV
jgi:hypothetical protein